MKQWILEVMGQILFLLRQNCSSRSFNFMFEMFVMGVAALAGNANPGVDFTMLPVIFSKLMRHEKYSQDFGPQFAEWMIELSQKDELRVSQMHKEVLSRSWIAIKACDGYKEASIWGRLTLQK